MGRGLSREHESAGQSQARPLSALVSAEAIGGRQGSLLVGLSEWVRLGGIGSLDHLLGASPSWQLCLAKAQGLAGRPPHHLPAPASSWPFHPQRLLKLPCFAIRPPQRGPLCSSQALGAGRGGGPKNSVQAKPWRQILSLPGTSRVVPKPKEEGLSHFPSPSTEILSSAEPFEGASQGGAASHSIRCPPVVISRCCWKVTQGREC